MRVKSGAITFHRGWVGVGFHLFVDFVWWAESTDVLSVLDDVTPPAVGN